MAFLVGGANTLDSSYEIENSLRLYGTDNYGGKTFSAGATDRQKNTVSMWVKRANLTTGSGTGMQVLFSNADNDQIGFDGSTDQLRFVSAGTMKVRTNRVFRDVGAWYHIVFAMDTTDGTAGNRIKFYVNGVQETSFETYTAISQNTNHSLFINQAHSIGRSQSDENRHFAGNIAEMHGIDGQQLDASYFGETDDNGVWIPKKYTGTYGDNGFYMEFKQTGTSANSSGIYADTSGNDHHFTPNNHNSTHIITDTPTNNFATFNFLHKASNVTLSEANCKAAIAGAGQSRSVTATIAVSKGKWYWETKYTTDVVSCFFGLVSADIGWNINATEYPSSGVSDNVGFNDGGTKYVNGTSSSYHSGGAGTVSDGDIVGCAANLDDDEVVFYVNGTALNSGTAISKTFSGDYFFVVQHQSSSGTSNFETNFGNPTYAISSGNSDGNGYGNFEYEPPTGFYSVCTKNLAQYG